MESWGWVGGLWSRRGGVLVRGCKSSLWEGWGTKERKAAGQGSPWSRVRRQPLSVVVGGPLLAEPLPHCCPWCVRLTVTESLAEWAASE